MAKKRINPQKCCGCGTCQAVCPKEAIKIIENKMGRYEPEIYERCCIFCGHCHDVCPVVEKGLANQPAGYKNYTAFYVNSTDKQILTRASSGGAVTQIIVNLLSKVERSKALVVSSTDNPLRPKPLLTDSIQDISETAGSKYCPVPVNSILNQIDWETDKIVYVGLPCHVEALKKYLLLKKIKVEHYPLIICLVCNKTPSFKATEFLLAQMKLPLNEMKSIHYRWGTWPGYIQVETNTGTKIKIDWLKAWSSGFGFYFQNTVCMNCHMKFNPFADIVAGDPWQGERQKKSKHGQTFMLLKEKSIPLIMESKNIAISQLNENECLGYTKALAKIKSNNFIQAWEKQIGTRKHHWCYIKRVSHLKQKYMRMRSIFAYYMEKISKFKKG